VENLLEDDREILGPLVETILALAARPEEGRKKEMWADHQALTWRGRIPVCVYYEGIPGKQWEHMFGRGFLACRSALARSIEYDLRRRIWMAENVPDDHIVWPSVVVGVPLTTVRDWGVDFRMYKRDELEAGAFPAPLSDGIDMRRLKRPRFEYRADDIRDTVERARELLGGRLAAHPAFDGMSFYATFDVATHMRGMENLFLDVAMEPAKVGELVSFITDVAVECDRVRERNGWLNVFPEDGGRWQQVGFRVHCAHLDEDFSGRPPRLSDEWHYLSQQCSAGLGPSQYARLVQPSNDRLAEYMTGGTVYYHACERLDEKMAVIKDTPNLRRFHVSPWTSLPKAVETFRGRVVLEVHDHPGKVFFGMTPEEMRAGIRCLIAQGDGHPMDLNISDIHSFNGRPELLGLWARIAREEVERAEAAGA
jgi:hypothetical protein